MYFQRAIAKPNGRDSSSELFETHARTGIACVFIVKSRSYSISLWRENVEEETGTAIVCYFFLTNLIPGGQKLLKYNKFFLIPLIHLLWWSRRVSVFYFGFVLLQAPNNGRCDKCFA